MAAADVAGQSGEGRRTPTGHSTAWRGWLAAGVAALGAMASVAFAASPATGGDDLAGPGGPGTAPSEWQRLALNALLVPLLEHEGELAWAEPNEMLPCRDSAEVTVDGRPLPHGKRLPLGRSMVVRFRLNDCWPLGSTWIGLWGTVEMTVLHEGPRLTAAIHPRGLSAAVNGARVSLPADFVGVVSLATAERRP